MTVRVAVPPAGELITIEEARLHLRVDAEGSPLAHPDDTLIMALVSAAREWCENFTARSLAPQTIEVILDAFPENEILLPRSPIADIISVTYIDTAAVEQTLASTEYVLDPYQEPGWLLPRIGTVWPATYGVVNAVKVRYLAGYSLPDDSPYSIPLPASIRAAMMLLLGHWYENREAVNVGNIVTPFDFAVEALLLPYRLRLSLA